MSSIKPFKDYQLSESLGDQGGTMDRRMTSELKGVMKAIKRRPAPFAVVAISPLGKVVAQDIDIKTWELIPAAFRLMHKAHPNAKIHVEDSEGQMVKESVEMLPSYEVIAGLALVLGASELHHAIKRGKLDDSMLVAIGKGLANKLGDGLQATGAAAKKIIDRFKGDPEVKQAILGAEEEINEQQSHHMSSIKSFESFFKGDGLTESKDLNIKIYRTITKQEWDKTPKDYKTTIDGVIYKMFLDPERGSILAPVEITG